jgi:NAD(P)-dependent dehydrogenase (short-subunit alcohol dehydrogenase family)
MELRLNDRTALVTGGSQGLGRAMARTFAAAGARVAIIGRDRVALDEAAAEIADAGGGRPALALSADVADPVALTEAHASAVDGIGPIDILVNNAGTSAAGPFLDISDDDWQHDFDLKFFAAVRLIRLCLPSMQERGWGRIINVLNTAAKAPPARSCPTSATRAAGMAMTKALASEVAGDGVLVNALNTGVLVTKQWEGHHHRRDPDLTWEEFLAKTGRATPVGRMGDAQEFANLALFLASDAASYITGTAINVDGGLSPVV